MLRNRSRAVTSKKSLMSDHSSPTKNPSIPISSFLGSPRFFNGLRSKSFSDVETAAMSPTSILDTKNSTNFVNPFRFDRNLSKITPSPSPEIRRIEPEAIGLALIDSIIDSKTDGNLSKPVNRMSLFGSKLKVQIPTINPPTSVSLSESPETPADFGIKTRNSHPFSPFPVPGTPSKDLCRQLSLKEMEMSEDYTCVIVRGPNPKTTHIYDDCIVGSCSGDDIKDPDHEQMDFGSEMDAPPSSPPVNFLSFCHTCKESLDQGKDIYIYRGEKAFCSHECRFEGMKNREMDDGF